ncbi:MAG TPA: hypothetical protein VH109_07530, partial [Steroidobacteraceae bacterium]|nr:hypothetical protein [Steroidobacteraceae bacterium]
MRTNHLFASAAIAAVLVATAPAQAQRLGGAVHGGLSARQGATFTDGFGRVHGGVGGEATASATGRAGVRTQQTDRVGTAAKAGVHDSVRGAQTIKGDAEATGRGAMQTSVSGAAKANNEGKATTAATADSVGRANLPTLGESEVQGGKLSARGESAGAISGRGAQNAQGGAGGKPAS